MSKEWMFYFKLVTGFFLSCDHTAKHLLPHAILISSLSVLWSLPIH